MQLVNNLLVTSKRKKKTLMINIIYIFKSFNHFEEPDDRISRNIFKQYSQKHSF